MLVHRARSWSVTSFGLQSDLPSMISPISTNLPYSCPNSPEDQDVFDSPHVVSILPKLKIRSNSISELFSGSWIWNNSSSEETVRPKATRFSLSMFQVGSKNNQKAGLSIVTLLNGNTILVYSLFGSEQNDSLFKAKLDRKINNYSFISASSQTATMFDSPCNVIGLTLEEVIEQDGGTNDEETKEIWSDLLRDEFIYQRSLMNLNSVYAEPIRDFSYLTPEEYEQIFFKIESLISLSLTLISQLESILKTWDSSDPNTDCIFSPEIWTIYNEYYHQYPQNKKLLEAKLEEESQLGKFCQENRISSGQSVEELLHLPCQRIPEYEQYLSNILERIEEKHPDYQSLKLAVNQIKKILQGNYQETNGTEQMKNNTNHKLNSPTQLEKEKVTENFYRRRSSPGAILFKNVGSSRPKFSRMSGDKSFDQDIVNFARYQSNFKRIYIMESAVQLTNSMQTQDRYLFLFDDVLLVAKQKSNNQFKLKYYVRICEMWLATCLDEISEGSHDEEKSFVVGWPTLNKVATFSSKDLKERWITILKKLIEDKKENEKPREIPIDIQNTDTKQKITLRVQNTSTVKEVLKKCLEEFQISKGDIEDYELWSEYSDNDTILYPLTGHEIPYNIKMNHHRQSWEHLEDCDNNESKKRKYDFLFMISKKNYKKHSSDDIDGKKKKRRPFNFFRKAAKSDEKPLGKLFGQPLNDTPPTPIVDLFEVLFRQGPSTSGIFRKCANAKKKQELCDILDHEEPINMADVTGNLAAAVLMEYMRNIPQGLLIDDKYYEWVSAEKLSNETEKLAKIQSLVQDLPPCNRQILQQLMCVLYYINKNSSKNMMGSQNLATCIAPSLIRPKHSDSQDDFMLSRDVITYMIENCVQIFGEEVISLFKDISIDRMMEDSDTDSFHSTLSTLGGLHPSDDSSMHSVDRDFVNAEGESSPTLLVTSDTDHFNNPRHFREEGVNTCEKRTMTKPPLKNGNLESESPTNTPAKNKSTSPVAPPRKSRQNYLGAKYKSMTATDKIHEEVPLQKDGSSKSANDLLSLNPGLSSKNQKLRSVQSPKRTLNSKILMTGDQEPISPTRIVRNKPIDQKSQNKNPSPISHYSDNGDSVGGVPTRSDRHSLGRIPQSKSIDVLDQLYWQQTHQKQPQQPQQPQCNTKTSNPNRKHLALAPRYSLPLTNKHEIRNEKEIKLALFSNCSVQLPVGKFPKEFPSKTHQELPRQHLKLSPPPNVLLQQIGQPLAPTKDESSGKRDTADGCRTSIISEEEMRVCEEHPESGRVPSAYMRQTYPENKKVLRKSINGDKKENEQIQQRPKHPPSYEEAIKLKQKQHEKSSHAESLYRDSLKEFNQISKSDKDHLKNPTNPSKYPDQKSDKLYRKNAVNNTVRSKSGQSQPRKSMPPSNTASTNRLQKNFSKSDSHLNFICTDGGSERKGTIQRTRPIHSSYSRAKNEEYNSLKDDDRRRRSSDRAKETKTEPGKRSRNGANQPRGAHKPLTKTKSVESILDESSKSKQSVLPWSVSDMIDKFAKPGDQDSFHAMHSSYK